MTAQKLKLVIDPNNPQFSTNFPSFRVVELVPDIEQQNKACKLKALTAPQQLLMQFRVLFRSDELVHISESKLVSSFLQGDNPEDQCVLELLERSRCVRSKIPWNTKMVGNCDGHFI